MEKRKKRPIRRRVLLAGCGLLFLLCVCAVIDYWGYAYFHVRFIGRSDACFTQVAATCDQMAVMCYDSGYLTPRAYVWLVRQQAIHVTHAAGQGNPQCRVLLGVPAYGDGFFSHNPHAENMKMALRGVREGLADPGADVSVFVGAAPFADYTASAQDWKVYETLWTAPRFSPP